MGTRTGRGRRVHTAQSRSRSSLLSGVVHPQRRVRALLIGTMVVFSLFAAQLVKMQGLEAASVSAVALDWRKQESVLPAARGQILDAFGQPLAEVAERKRLVASSVAVATYRKRIDGERVVVGAAGAAADIAAITGDDPARLQRALEEDPEALYVILNRDISPKIWQDIAALSIPGIYAEDNLTRTYPMGEAPAPLIGWFGSGGMPAGGIEQIYNDILTGTPGRQVFEVGGRGEIITTGESEIDPAVPGQDVHTTLDSDLQFYAYERICDQVEAMGADSGYVIVTDARTNAVLAASSCPSYDPSRAPSSPEDLRAAVIEDAYEPGSTGKLIAAAAALELGLVEAETPIELPAGHRLPRGGTLFKDSTTPRDNYPTFAGVLTTSSNMGTILYGEHIEDQVLYDYFRKFGIGEVSGLGLPGESPGLIHRPEDWSATTKYTMIFGQGVTSNALQQHTVFQAIANDGVKVKPSLVAGITDAQGRYHEAEPGESSVVVSPEVAHELTGIMESVPTINGTAPLAAVDGYRVAGKTSTADRVDPQTGRYNGVTSAFVGYAPAEDPKFVVSVVLQRPRAAKYGGQVAGPVFAEVMRYALQKYQIPPSTEPSPEYVLHYDPEDQAPGEPSGVTLGDIAIKHERDN